MSGNKPNRILLVVVAVGLTLVPAAWGQEERAPLSLTGNLGVGYSTLQNNGLSASSSIFNGDADLSGYWRDPRILLFNVDPVVSFGNAFASSIDLANRGKGITASTTVLGGSPFPVSVSYSRLWQQLPGYSTTGNILGTLATSFDSDDLAIDWGLFWGKLPPLSFHYGTGNSNTEFPQLLGNSHENHKIFSASTYYSLAGWRIDGGYSHNRVDALRADLLNLGAPALPENSHAEDLHVSAQRSLPLQSLFSVSAGNRKWDDTITGLQSNNSYDFVRAVANSHPLNRLNLNLNSGYTSNASAAVIQQLLGLQGANSTPGVIVASGLNSSTFTSAHTVDFGGGAQYGLPRGFSVGGDASVGKFSSSLGLSGDTLLWDASLNYLHRLRRSGSLTASYGYQHGETDAVSLTGASTSRTLRAGVSNVFPHELQLGGSMHYDQTNTESSSISSGRIESPGHGYGFILNASRPLNRGWKLFGDFELNNNFTEFPLQFESHNKSFGIRAESRAWQLSVRRTYQDGLALQIGNGLVFVNNPQGALLSPLSSVLSNDSNVQTIFLASFRPGSKRLIISGSWTRFGYDNKGLHVTDATLINGLVAYRLRRLRLQAGYFLSTSEAYLLTTSPTYRRQEIYFEVIRHFRLF